MIVVVGAAPWHREPRCGVCLALTASQAQRRPRLTDGLPVDGPFDRAATGRHGFQRERLELSPQGRIDRVGRAIRRADDGSDAPAHVARAHVRPACAAVRTAVHVATLAQSAHTARPVCQAWYSAGRIVSSLRRSGGASCRGRPRSRSPPIRGAGSGTRRWRTARTARRISRRVERGRRQDGPEPKSVVSPAARRSAASITPWKIGAAPVTPLELRSGVRSKLPTQTPTVTCLE